MKAIVTTKAGPPEVLQLEERLRPEVKAGWVLVKIHATGMNRSEMYTRQGHSPNVKFPRIQGIECVGEVAHASDSDLAVGQKVAAMMGEMGREFDGGYAEYALLPRSIIIPIETSLDWLTFAAIPETYQTAYGSLKKSLRAQSGETLLIRGGTSALGMATLGLARAWGLKVISTTRSEAKAEKLRELGATEVVIEDGKLSEKNLNPDLLLELVGTTTLRDSLKTVRPGGTVCFTGILGNSWHLENFAPFEDIPSTTRLTVYAGEGMSQPELQEVVELVEQGKLHPNIFRVFKPEEIVEAHHLMQDGKALGKLVIDWG